MLSEREYYIGAQCFSEFHDRARFGAQSDVVAQIPRQNRCAGTFLRRHRAQRFKCLRQQCTVAPTRYGWLLGASKMHCARGVARRCERVAPERGERVNPRRRALECGFNSAFCARRDRTLATVGFATAQCNRRGDQLAEKRVLGGGRQGALGLNEFPDRPLRSWRASPSCAAPKGSKAPHREAAH